MRVFLFSLIFPAISFCSLIVLTSDDKLKCNNNLYSLNANDSTDISLVYSSTNLAELFYSHEYGELCGNPRIMVDFRLVGKEYLKSTPEPLEFSVFSWYLDIGKTLINSTTVSVVIVSKTVAENFFFQFCDGKNTTPVFFKNLDDAILCI